MHAHLEEVLNDIRSRDEQDCGRELAPLTQTADAIVLDTSELDAKRAIAEAIRLTEERLSHHR
jgi:cytidylate kinase